MKERTGYFDFLRGIAILMVIAIHTSTKPDFDNISNVFQIFVRQIVGCPVPIFLAISGYFLGAKLLESKEQKISFWKRQIIKVYIPGLLWSLPLFALSIKRGNNLIAEIISLFFMGYSIYYFIALIIQCYLLLPLLQKINFSKWGYVISFISIFCGFSIAYLGANRLPLTIYAGPCITWLVFFCMGIFLNRTKRDYGLKYLFICLIVSICFMMAEAWALYTHGLGGYGLKPSVYIYSTIVILILFSNKVKSAYNERNKLNRILNYIGRISFGIYLTHCYWIMIFNQFYKGPWIIKWGLITIISIVCIMLLRKLLPETTQKYIGIK